MGTPMNSTAASRAVPLRVTGSMSMLRARMRQSGSAAGQVLNHTPSRPSLPSEDSVSRSAAPRAGRSGSSKAASSKAAPPFGSKSPPRPEICSAGSA